MASDTHSAHAHDFDWAAMVAFAELEAEALMSSISEAIASLSDLAARHGVDVRRVLDVGSGPGVATCALAERFPPASVVAADGSAEMLANAATRAARLGLADRVATRLVELPEGLAALDRFDLVWASMVLHHVGDEAAALRGLRERLEPGGLLALVEFGDSLRVVPQEVDLGRPGLWERLDAAGAAWLADMRAGLPGAAPSADYTAMMEAAGFEVLLDRPLTVQLEPPLDDRSRRVALGHLQMTRRHVEPYSDAGDLQAIDVLTDEAHPEGILRRADARLHASRRLLVARAVPGTTA